MDDGFTSRFGGMSDGLAGRARHVFGLAHHAVMLGLCRAVALRHRVGAFDLARDAAHPGNASCGLHRRQRVGHVVSLSGQSHDAAIDGRDGDRAVIERILPGQSGADVLGDLIVGLFCRGLRHAAVRALVRAGRRDLQEIPDAGYAVDRAHGLFRLLPFFGGRDRSVQGDLATDGVHVDRVRFDAFGRHERELRLARDPGIVRRTGMSHAPCQNHDQRSTGCEAALPVKIHTSHSRSPCDRRPFSCRIGSRSIAANGKNSIRRGRPWPAGPLLQGPHDAAPCSCDRQFTIRDLRSRQVRAAAPAKQCDGKKDERQDSEEPSDVGRKAGDAVES